MFNTNEKVTKVSRFRVPSRPPSGAMQFGSDWPGLFLRGDDAVYLLVYIRGLKNTLEQAGLDPSTEMGLLFELAEIIENNIAVNKDTA